MRYLPSSCQSCCQNSCQIAAQRLPEQARANARTHTARPPEHEGGWDTSARHKDSDSKRALQVVSTAGLRRTNAPMQVQTGPPHPHTHPRRTAHRKRAMHALTQNGPQLTYNCVGGCCSGGCWAAILLVWGIIAVPWTLCVFLAYSYECARGEQLSGHVLFLAQPTAQANTRTHAERPPEHVHGQTHQRTRQAAPTHPHTHAQTKARANARTHAERPPEHAHGQTDQRTRQAGPTHPHTHAQTKARANARTHADRPPEHVDGQTHQRTCLGLSSTRGKQWPFKWFPQRG